MTALATAATAHPRPARAGRAVLRLHRPALIFWVIFVAVVSAALLWAYGPLGDAAHSAWERECTTDDVCEWSDALTGYDLVHSVGEALIHFVPVLVALWAGGLLIGRELESGTAQLAWTQAVSPARWLTAKLTLPAVLLTAGTTLLVLLHRLLFEADRIKDSWTWNDSETFYANGTIAIAFPLLALAVGALAGLIAGRAVPGLIGGILATASATTLIGLAGPHLVPWRISVGDLKEGYAAPADVIHGGEGAVTSTGAHIADPCVGAGKACPAAHDIVGYYSEYHPSSQFWALQLTQTALILTVAALATATAFTLLRRRTA
ncbi:hypothetical protein [Streptomyces sp. NPDC001100]